MENGGFAVMFKCSVRDMIEAEDASIWELANDTLISPGEKKMVFKFLSCIKEERVR